MTLRDVSDGPPRVWIGNWTHPVYGDRFTINEDDRAVRTFGTELEARRFAREMGWIVASPRPDAGEDGR